MSEKIQGNSILKAVDQQLKKPVQSLKESMLTTIS